MRKFLLCSWKRTTNIDRIRIEFNIWSMDGWIDRRVRVESHDLFSSLVKRLQSERGSNKRRKRIWFLMEFVRTSLEGDIISSFISARNDPFGSSFSPIKGPVQLSLTTRWRLVGPDSIRMERDWIRFDAESIGSYSTPIKFDWISSYSTRSNVAHHIWYRIFINKSYRCWEYFFKYFQDILVLKNWMSVWF